MSGASTRPRRRSNREKDDRAAVVADDLHVAVDEADLGTLLEHGHLAGELVERPGVVAVEQGDQLAAGLAEGAIHRADEAAVLLMDDPHARLGPEPRVEHPAGAVGRAVVDHHDLDELARIVLAQRAVDRGGDEALMVVGRDDGGHGGAGGTGHHRVYRLHAAGD
jgi:hypothetical protein